MAKTSFAILYGVLIGLLAAGLILLIDQQPQGHAVVLLPTFTPQPLVVEVSGAVQHPGVYHLPAGSRIQKAVEAAGGFTQDASRDWINLAAQLSDGSKIVVPRVGEETDTSTHLLPGSAAAAGTNHLLININTATSEELEDLPGIGPSKAQQICDYRQENGLFDKIEDLMEVPGIGPGIFDQIKSLITS